MTPSSSRLVSWWHTCSEGRMFCSPYLKQKIGSDACGPPWAPACLRTSPFGEGNGILYGCARYALSPSLFCPCFPSLSLRWLLHLLP